MILNRTQEIKYYEEKIKELKQDLESYNLKNPSCNSHKIRIKQAKLRIKRMTSNIELLTK